VHIRKRGLAAAAVSAALAAAVLAVPSQAQWSTISDTAAEVGLVCRDGISFQYGFYVSDPSQDEYVTPQADRQTVLGITVSSTYPAPVSPGTAALDLKRTFRLRWYPRPVKTAFGSIYMTVWGGFVPNWDHPLAPGTFMRLIFDYPDTNNNRTDVTDDPAGHPLTVKDCLLPKIQIRNGGPQTINMSASGNIPVALLSNPKFNATTVKPTSVHFGSATRRTKAVSSSKGDVNGDGRPDLKLNFKISQLGLCNADGRAVLDAKTGKTPFIADSGVTVTGASC
jgi:hypothetical protein